MSKRSFIIAAIAIVLFVAALFSVVMDFKKSSPEDLNDEDINNEDHEPGTERNTGPRKGFYYNRELKKYVPAKVKAETKPEPETELKTEKEIINVE
jgi:hypothetical protein